MILTLQLLAGSLFFALALLACVVATLVPGLLSYLLLVLAARPAGAFRVAGDVYAPTQIGRWFLGRMIAQCARVSAPALRLEVVAFQKMLDGGNVRDVGKNIDRALAESWAWTRGRS